MKKFFYLIFIFLILPFYHSTLCAQQSTYHGQVIDDIENGNLSIIQNNNNFIIFSILQWFGGATDDLHVVKYDKEEIDF